LSYINIHIGEPMLYIALVMTLISGADYIYKSRHLFQPKKQ